MVVTKWTITSKLTEIFRAQKVSTMDIEYLGTYHPFLKTVRILQETDVRDIMKSTQRPLSQCRIVIDKELLLENSLRLGEGIFLALQLRSGIHTVSIYRCYDDKYLYYDSTPRPVHYLFRDYIKKHRISWS